MRKFLFFIITTLLVSGPGYGQKFSKAFSGAAGKKKVEIIAENAGLEIEGYAGNEVVIETVDYEGPPERAKGLRPLYNGASDNTGVGLEVQESAGVITIKKATSQSLDYHIRIPAGASLSIREIGWSSDDIVVRGVSGEIEIKSNGSDILLDNVTGPVVANTTSGDIEAVFSQLSQEGPTSISNVSGHIDITLPAAARANLDLSSISGEIYTDMDIKMEGGKSGMAQIGGRKVRGALNGGGVELSLRAISDNIYLRKK